MFSTPGLFHATAEAQGAPLELLLQRIQDGSARIGVVGLGYVGLPLAAEFGNRFRVVGFDANPQRVEALNAGGSHIIDVPAARISELVNAEKFEATGDFKRLQECDAIVICVPTPLEKS